MAIAVASVKHGSAYNISLGCDAETSALADCEFVDRTLVELSFLEPWAPYHEVTFPLRIRNERISSLSIDLGLRLGQIASCDFSPIVDWISVLVGECEASWTEHGFY